MSITDKQCATAMSYLYPTGGYTINGTDIRMDNGQPEPTEAQLQAALIEANKMGYKQLRAHAYPPIGDQLGALWKGGQAQADMANQIAAVKAQYPKPE